MSKYSSGMQKNRGWSTCPTRKIEVTGLFSLEKRRLRRDLTEAFQYL